MLAALLFLPTAACSPAGRQHQLRHRYPAALHRQAPDGDCRSGGARWVLLSGQGWASWWRGRAGQCMGGVRIPRVGACRRPDFVGLSAQGLAFIPPCRRTRRCRTTIGCNIRSTPPACGGRSCPRPPALRFLLLPGPPRPRQQGPAAARGAQSRRRWRGRRGSTRPRWWMCFAGRGQWHMRRPTLGSRWGQASDCLLSLHCLALLVPS